MSWESQTLFDQALSMLSGRTVMQLWGKNRLVRRSDISVVRWGLEHCDATGRASVQAPEEMNWAPVAKV